MKRTKAGSLGICALIVSTALVFSGCPKSEGKGDPDMARFKDALEEFSDEMDPPAPITTEPAPDDKTRISLSFESFDGGGHEYEVKIADPDIVEWTSYRAYNDPNHEEMNGSSYDYVVVLTPKAPGITELMVHGTSPIIEEVTYLYTIEVASDLSMTVTEVTE